MLCLINPAVNLSQHRAMALAHGAGMNWCWYTVLGCYFSATQHGCAQLRLLGAPGGSGAGRRWGRGGSAGGQCRQALLQPTGQVQQAQCFKGSALRAEPGSQDLSCFWLEVMAFPRLSGTTVNRVERTSLCCLEASHALFVVWVCCWGAVNAACRWACQLMCVRDKYSRRDKASGAGRKCQAIHCAILSNKQTSSLKSLLLAAGAEQQLVGEGLIWEHWFPCLAGFTPCIPWGLHAHHHHHHILLLLLTNDLRY